MNTDVVRYVRQRAQGRCEYCQLSSALHRTPFQIDHIIARQHGGSNHVDNLALACIRCNRYKGPNVAGIDSVTGKLIRLFHPRIDRWGDHFRWNEAEIVPLSSVGRVTVDVLLINDPVRRWLRSALAAENADEGT